MFNYEKRNKGRGMGGAETPGHWEKAKGGGAEKEGSFQTEPAGKQGSTSSITMWGNQNY